jgi:fructoselysine and glucoselysine-specific PTS system IIC component
MWLDLLLVSVVGGVVAVDTTAAWQFMICRPLVSGPLLGWLLGDLHTGLIMGALLELVWAGIVPAGASVFPDSNVAAAVAIAIAVKLQQIHTSFHFAVPLSILYSVPVAYFGSRVIVRMRRRNSIPLRRALEYAERGDGRNVARQNWVGVVNSFVRGFIYGGFMFVSGVLVLSELKNFLPPWGVYFSDISLVPILALGGAVPLAVFGKRRTIPYILLGFAGGALLSLS